MTINEMIHEIPHMRYRLESTKHKETLDEIEEVLRHHKEGTWIKLADRGYRCSFCGEVFAFADDFCEKCGSKMESEDIGDYPDEIPNQFDNLTGSMNI